MNTVIDEHRQLSFVNYGEVVESHIEAVRFIRDYAQVVLPRRFQTVVTSAAGYPLDKTYYQTVKGMVSPLDILDHDVPILDIVHEPTGARKAIVFGYACHNTTLPATFVQYHGDYAGVAQAGLGQRHRGVTAMFVNTVMSWTVATLDLSSWYADRALFAMVFVVALLAYGAWTALGGVPILGDPLRDAEPIRRRAPAAV